MYIYYNRFFVYISCQLTVIIDNKNVNKQEILTLEKTNNCCFINIACKLIRHTNTSTHLIYLRNYHYLYKINWFSTCGNNVTLYDNDDSKNTLYFYPLNIKFCMHLTLFELYIYIIRINIWIWKYTSNVVLEEYLKVSSQYNLIFYREPST